MNNNDREPGLRRQKYVVALGAVLVAAIARYLLGGVLGEDAPLLLFTLAVVVAGWFGGLKPGLLATAAGLAIGLLLFVGPIGGVLPVKPSDQLRVVLFVVIGVAVSWLCENLHAARRRLVTTAEDERTWMARYEAAVESSGSVLYDYEYAARRGTFGGSTEALLGLQAQDMPKDFDGFLDLVHPDDRATLGVAAAAAQAQGGTFSMAYRLRRSDGEYVTVQDDGRVFRAQGGDALRIIGLLDDVSEQRRASTALRETSQQLLLSLRVGRAAAFTWDIPADEVRILHDGIVLSLDIAADAPGSFEAAVAKVHPDDRGAFEQRVRHAIERPGREYTNQYRRLWPDGSLRWISDTGRVEFGADGKPLRLIGLATDITERKQAEGALRESEHRLRLAMESAATGMWDWDLATDAVAWSAECYPVFGLAEGAFDGTSAGFDRLVHPDDKAGLWAAVDAATQAHTSYEAEFRIVHPDGQVRWVSNLGRAAYDEGGQPVRMVGTVRDITDRKRGEEQVRSSEERLRQYLDHAPAQIAVFDHEMRYLYANRRWLADFKLAGRAVAGASHYEVLPDVPEHWREVHRRGLQGEVVSQDEDRFDRQDGSVQWVRWEVRPWRPVSGEGGGIIIYSEDITERKQAEERLRQQTATLRAIADATPDLIFVKDIDCRLTFANPATLGVLGLTEQQAIGREASELYTDPSEGEAITANDRRIMAAGVSEAVEELFTGPHGTRTFLSTKTALRDGSAGVVGIVGVTRDITERKRMEADLREREAFISGVLGSITDGLYSLGKDWRFTFVNGEMARRFGRPKDEIVGGQVWQLFPDAVGNQAHVGLHRAMAERTPVTYEVFYPPSQRWLLESAYPAADGGLAVFSRDITVGKQAEQALQASEEFNRSLMDGSPDCVKVLDLEGRLLHMNAHGLCLMEIDDAAPMYGQAWPDLWPPGARQDIERAVAAAGAGSTCAFEAFCPTAKGAPRWWDVSVSPIRDGAGRVVRLLSVSRDITKRKQAEEQVSEARHFLLACIDALSSHVAVLDENGVIVTVNEAWRRFADANEYAGRDHGVGANYLTVSGQDCGENAATAGLADVLAGRRAYFEVEYACHSPTEERWFVLRATPFRWEGRVRVVVAHENVTARRQAETERHRAEAQYRNIVEGNAALICRIRPDGRLTFVNDTYCRTFNRSRESLVGHRFTPLVPDEDRPLIARLLERLVPDMAPYTHEHRVVLPDGQTRWQRWTNKPVADTAGEGIEYLGIGFDITDRKRAEQRSGLLSEAAMALLVTDEPDAMLQGLFARIGPPFGLDLYFNYMADPDAGDLRLASAVGVSDDERRAFARLGYGQAVCGSVATSRTPHHARHIQQSDDPREQALKGIGLRAYVCHPLVSGSVLLGTLAFGSRSKDSFASDELDFLHTICNYVIAAYERLRLVNQLRETDRRKNEFLATLAHELRNPLAPIRNGLQIMKLAGANPAALDKARSMMERQVGQMAHLIDDLMDLSRISQGKFLLQKARLKVADAVQDAVDISRPLIEAQGHELVVDLPPEPLYVDADRTRLAQVFGNLLNNAAKYTPTGGRIRVAVERRGGDVVVAVEDNGVGIPAAMLTRVFDMFTQVDRSLEKSQGGLGIGLSIVRKLVEMHDGKISVESAGDDKGSRFTVLLPVVLSVVNGGKLDDPAAGFGKSEPAARRRVLIADDNDDGATSLAEMLNIMGCETQTAFDGIDAVAAAEAFQPDLILMDIGMPRLNGYEACRLIRAKPWGRNTVIVAQTGWGQEEDKRQSQEAGFDFHMVKPIDPGDLEKMLAGLKAKPASTRG